MHVHMFVFLHASTCARERAVSAFSKLVFYSVHGNTGAASGEPCLQQQWFVITSTTTALRPQRLPDIEAICAHNQL